MGRSKRETKKAGGKICTSLMNLLQTRCKEHSIMCGVKECFEYLYEFPEKYEQMSLF